MKRSQKTIRKIIFVALCVFCASEVVAVITQPVYLSASGNNSSNGLTHAAAWKTVLALDSRTFGPGAQILFNRGDSFVNGCTLVGSGSAASPIIIGAYGTGDKPLLTGFWDKEQIFKLTDNEYIEFQDLQMRNFNTNNATIQERFAIYIDPPLLAGGNSVDHLYFRNLDFFEIEGHFVDLEEDDDEHRSIGILAEIGGQYATDSNPTRFNDFLVDGCTFTDIDGLGVQLQDFSQDIADFKIDATPYYPSVGFVFQNNYGTNVYRNLLMLRGTQDALVQYNTMDTTVEGSAFWPFATDGTVVQYNLFMNLFADDADAYVCHFDYNCIDTLMQYNIGYNVEGGLIEYIVNSAWNGFQENGIARYNIGIDVGYRDATNSAGIFLTGRVEGGQFYNNTIVQLSQPVYKAISFHNWNSTGSDNPSWPTNNAIYNNIFYAANTESGYNQQLRGIKLGNEVSHNLYYGDNIIPPRSWIEGAWVQIDQNPFTGNPQFANPAGLTAEDFKVIFGSAAISNGLLIASNGGRDYFDYGVSSNSLPTLGFHEYQSDPDIDSDGDKMTDLWESGNGLNPGSAADATVDTDSDLLVNLAEFALGGNPNDGGDIGYVPYGEVADVGGGSNVFAYVHARRTDWQDRGLDYDLGVSTNLLTGPWDNGVHTVNGVGSEAYGAGFDAVTNHIPIDVAERFIRLEIE